MTAVKWRLDTVKTRIADFHSASWPSPDPIPGLTRHSIPLPALHRERSAGRGRWTGESSPRATIKRWVEFIGMRFQPAAPGWHRRMMQSLLYGRSVDRAGKVKARLGLAVFGFALVYAIIALRLVLYAVTADAHMVRRAGSTDAVATARPDILDRNGEILATDLKTPSLFAEPRRIIDPDEATELLAGVLPDLDSREVRDRLGSKRGFAWL